MKIVLVEVIPQRSMLTMELVPPLGLGYIASALESRGHTVSIVEGISYGDSLSDALELITRQKPDIVGYTATSQARIRAMELIKMVKQQNRVFSVAGGPHFAPTGKEALEAIEELDVVVKGDGELTMCELAEAYNQGKNLENIRGIIYRKGSQIAETQDRPIDTNLGEIPSPAYHLFHLEKYRCTLEGTNLPSIGVVSSRGCPNNCIFCANKILRKNFLRLREPNKFVDEIEFLKNKYGYRAFDFWDDTLTMSRMHIERICEEILRRGLDIKWFARARVNTVDAGILSLMKRAGCIAISYGVESGSERILKVVNKGTNVAQAEEAVRISAELGFIVSAYFIVSLPNETLSDIDATLALMKQFSKYKNVHNYYCFVMIYPGTDLEKMAVKAALMPDGFSWYKPYFSPRNLVIGNDPAIPCYENRNLKLQQIKSHIIRSTPLMNVLKSAAKRVIRIIKHGT